MAEPTERAERLDQRVAAVRRFNRFYTRQIGLLQERMLKTPFSLTEARVIYELAHHEETTATRLGEELGLDAGYLSRILRGFNERGLIDRTASESDARQNLLRLTDQGEKAFAELNAASHHEIAAMLNERVEDAQAELIRAMHSIERLLGAPDEHRVPYILRPHQPGDIGWIVHRHGVLYSREYQWDERFEALVAEIAAAFIQNYDPKRERCWIAEKDGENIGSVLLVKHPEREGVAKLRLLLVEPKARGLGVGKRLVSECTRFARRVGYRAITLWTSDLLHAAHRIYEQEGYKLAHQEPHDGFGYGLVVQTWELAL